ncbi:uncharacterized protein LOC111291227 isoform X1 [Durio zibethinus]|uniref:Uncharacterized protein LOC111291227 isoform X1 n=1 Tax=Durio zibethinus TaxID=66656 RepID=A0A6P5YE05_DURZI|nr:uncharacterized protein LOC111291227 isoform X1 [Durio zibethinus]
MDFPLFGNPWNASSRPCYEQSLRGIPVQLKPKAMPPQPLNPKVVSIPVRFVGSERGTSDSVIKIQKVFRGFLVRKNMKRIKAIREEVNDIERSVSKKETVDLIRNDSKERLKVNEMLMGLLLKLDSVRGVDSGVRDCRKSVIKKAIALQELVDAVVSGDQSIDSNDAEAIDQSQGIADSADNCNQTLESQNDYEITNDTEAIDQSQGITDSADNCNQTLESQNHDEITNDAEFVPNLNESKVILQKQETVESNKQVVANQEDEESMESKSQVDSANLENLVEEEEAALDADDEKEGNKNNKEDCGENKRSKELLGRMMEDNEKIMGLMTVLLERNEMQNRLLSALSRRVERLEKVFLCDKLRRKKRRSVVGSDDCVEKRRMSKNVE